MTFVYFTKSRNLIFNHFLLIWFWRWSNVFWKSCKDDIALESFSTVQLTGQFLEPYCANDLGLFLLNWFRGPILCDFG